MIFLLDCESFVVDITARSGEFAHVAFLFSVRLQLEFKDLLSFHALNILWSMRNNKEIRHGRHCKFLMHVHLVFVTKYRRGVFTKDILDSLLPIFSSVCKDFEADLVEFDGEDDHVHLLVNYPPKVAVSRLVNSLKGISSLLIRRKEYPSIREKLWGGSLWSPSYFAGSCGGASLEVIRQYIEQQKTSE